MTRTNTLIIILLTSTGLLAGSAWALQSGQRGNEVATRQGSQGQRPPRPPLDGALDANNDHQIDAAEIAAAATVIMRLDADGDGVLSVSECLPQPPRNEGGGGAREGRGRMRGAGSAAGSGRMGSGRGAGGPVAPSSGSMGSGGGGEQGQPGERPKPPIFSALDSNGDQRLEAAEIKAAPTALLNLDRDGDGRLSDEECRPQGRGAQGRESVPQQR